MTSEQKLRKDAGKTNRTIDYMVETLQLSSDESEENHNAVTLDDINIFWDAKVKAFKPTKELLSILLENLRDNNLSYFEAPF